MPKYYPINLSLENKKCLVIGAGSVALRKIRRLVECGAHVLVISPTATSAVQAMARKGKIVIKRRRVTDKDLKNAYLVIAATADRKVNAAVSASCDKRGILVNVVDTPAECNFILPSVLRRGDLTISISTDGVSPALSKKIRQDLEKTFGDEYAVLLRIMKEMRPEVLKKIKDEGNRKRFFNKVLDRKIMKLIKRKKLEQASRNIKDLLNDAGT